MNFNSIDYLGITIMTAFVAAYLLYKFKIYPNPNDAVKPFLAICIIDGIILAAMFFADFLIALKHSLEN
jgi:hypothetical protein